MSCSRALASRHAYFRRTRAFTLVEAAAATVLLGLVSAAVLYGAITLTQQLTIYDALSALSDESIRQAEIVRALPLQTLVADTPISTATGISAPYVPPGVNPLNGFLPDPISGSGVPSVTWVRTRTQFAYGPQKYIDSVVITAISTRAMVPLTNQVTVVRLFDAGQ